MPSPFPGMDPFSTPRWSHKAEREFKRRVRRLTSSDPRSVCARGVSMEHRLAKLSQYV